MSLTDVRANTRKTITGATTDFVHDGINPVTESSAGGTGFLLTGLGVDDFMMRIGPVSTSMFLTDALGSLVATTDAAGVVQSAVTYEPVGNIEISAPAPAYRFTGREHDEPLYLYYYRARYYHTDLQRFISEDPIGFRGGDANLYAYVRNNPIALIDPTGLLWFYWHGAISAAAAYSCALSANMSETATPWTFSVEGEQGSEADERSREEWQRAGDGGCGEAFTAAVHPRVQAADRSGSGRV